MTTLDGILYGLAIALGHSLWQVALAAAAHRALRSSAPADASQRYSLGLVLLGAAFVAFVGTWWSAVAALPAGPVSASGLAAAAAAGVPLASLALADLGPHVWIGAAWLLGVALINLRTLAAYLWLRLALARPAVAASASIEARFATLAHRLGVDSTVALRLSRAAGSPLTIGWLRPVVYLPVSVATGLSPDHLDAILLHELCHIRRLDFLVNAVQTAVDSVFFFHPAAWWLSGQIRRERELCCDARAAAAVGDGVRYARALVECEALRVGGPASLGAPALAVSATGGDLARRVRAVAGGGAGAGAAPRVDRLRPLLSAAGGVAVVLVCAGVTVGACGETAADPQSVGVETKASSISWLPPSVSVHLELFERVGQRVGVPAELLALVSLVESGGDPRAESSRGALGLMQLMPSTAAAVAREQTLADGDLGRERLLSPELNVELGARYLRAQMDAFAGDDPDATLAAALAAYNAGPARARAANAGTRRLPSETTDYVELITELWRDRQADESVAYQHWRARAREAFFMDKAVPMSGTAVVAPKPAVVAEVGEDADYGRFVILRHGRYGMQTRYHHLEFVGVQTGQRVALGEQIATVEEGDEGDDPPLQVELLDHGARIDPTFLLGDDC